MPADLHADADTALRSLEMGFLPALGGSKGFASQYVSEREPDLRIDFLTVARRSKSSVIAPDLGVSLSPLKFMDYLLEAPGQAVLINRNDACLVNLPDPARYGLHKLIVAAERGARHPKYRKDILQALALIEWHLAHARTALLDAWQDLAGRGTGWSKRARESLAQAPPAQADLVAAFAKLAGLK